MVILLTLSGLCYGAESGKALRGDSIGSAIGLAGEFAKGSKLRAAQAASSRVESGNP